ncbi:MAG: hypothetical protein NHB32_21155 [Fischerella sp. CENA71]|nr:hypothetical protein [Fischerella sp. CENA71]
MSTEGSREQRRQVVADVASKLFGVEIKASNVIDETLERSIKRDEPTIEELRQSIQAGLPPESEQTLEKFQKHPLAAWIEMNFGLEDKEGHLVRRQPITLQEGAEKLASKWGKSSQSAFCRHASSVKLTQTLVLEKKLTFT